MNAVGERDFQHLLGGVRSIRLSGIEGMEFRRGTRSPPVHSRWRAKRVAGRVASNPDSIISSRPVDRICLQDTCCPAWAGLCCEVEPRYRLCSGTRPGYCFSGLAAFRCRLKSPHGGSHFGLLPLSGKDPIESFGSSLPASPSRWQMLLSAYRTQVQGRKSRRPNCEEAASSRGPAKCCAPVPLCAQPMATPGNWRSSTHGQTHRPVRCEEDGAVVSAGFCELLPEDLGPPRRDQGTGAVHEVSGFLNRQRSSGRWQALRMGQASDRLRKFGKAFVTGTEQFRMGHGTGAQTRLICGKACRTLVCEVGRNPNTCLN